MHGVFHKQPRVGAGAINIDFSTLQPGKQRGKRKLTVLLALSLLSFQVHPQTLPEGEESVPESNIKALESAPSEEALDRERDAEEDPLAQRQSERIEMPEAIEEEPNKLDWYVSARLRFRRAGDSWVFGDSGSRVGLAGQWRLGPRILLFGRAEGGFNLANKIDGLLDPGNRSDNDSSIFTRLLYVGIETPRLNALYGKNWSTYYQIASFTDRLDATGGSGTAFANAGTDGGATGTGRADNVLQARLNIDVLPDNWWFKPFKLNIQLQHGEPIPEVSGAHYGTAFGASAILHLRNEYTLGIAYNRAYVDDSPTLKKAGIDGDQQALLIGTRMFDDDWYLGLTVSRLLNHQTTEQKIYFDSWGGELYGQYQIYPKLWLTGGWNYLKPDHDEKRTGDFRVNFLVPGLRYTFEGTRRFIFLNYRRELGQTTDGQSLDNIATLGIRWDFP